MAVFGWIRVPGISCTPSTESPFPKGLEPVGNGRKEFTAGEGPIRAERAGVIAGGRKLPNVTAGQKRQGQA